MITVLHHELFHKLTVMLYLTNMDDQSILDKYIWLKVVYIEFFVQYGSEGSELILVPIILKLNELTVHWGELYSVQFPSFVSFSVSAQSVQCRMTAAGPTSVSTCLNPFTTNHKY